MRREAEIGQPAPEAADDEADATRLPSASMAGKRGLIMGVANDRSIA